MYEDSRHRTQQDLVMENIIHGKHEAHGEPKWNTDVKDDWEKPDLSLLPPAFLEQTGMALTYGARKYGRGNWTHVERHRFIAALLRHICREMRDPGGIDDESGLPHTAHIAANIALIIGLDELARNDPKTAQEPATATPEAQWPITYANEKPKHDFDEREDIKND